MKKLIRLLSVIPVMTIFACMAIASGSSSDNKERGEITVSSDKEKSTSSNSSEKTDTSEITTSKEATTQPVTEEEKLQYEVSGSRFNYYKNSIGSIEFYGIVEVKNTGNCNIYLDDCIFDIEDNEGHLLQSESWISNVPDVIAPGETGYFYNGLGSDYLDSSVSADNGLVLKPQFSLKKSTKEIVEYDVSDTDMRAGSYGGIKFTGRVTNNTSEDDSYVSVGIICYDGNGDVLLITSTTVDDLAAGMTRSFDTNTTFDDDSVKYEDIASYKVIARKNTYQW